MFRLQFPVLFAVLFVSTSLADEQSEVPTAKAASGTPTIDGKIDEVWSKAEKVKVDRPVESLLKIDQAKMATATVQLLWDQQHLYALWIVNDTQLSKEAGNDWEQDSVELFLDRNMKRSTFYQFDDAQYRVNYEGKRSGGGDGYLESDLEVATAKPDEGYVVEMAIRIEDVELKSGTRMGLELQVNDSHGSGTRDAVAKWYHTEDDSWENTSVFATVELQSAADPRNK